MILITGAAGFIGFHVSRKLLKHGYKVAGLDNMNDYYSPELKHDRVNVIKNHSGFSFHEIDLCDKEALDALFKNNPINIVIHLAAQVGVRYSLEKPLLYQRSNLEGFLNILEVCRHHSIENLIYASSSSVYGKNTKLPYSESDVLEGQISLYGATKRANELMAHSYSHLYGLKTTGIRFFTVYGPWGRPDMAIFKFTSSILEGSEIEVYNNGNMHRDFTYIDDVVDGVIACLDHPVEYEIINLGNNRSVELLYMIRCLEDATGMKAKKKMLPLQPGDCLNTYADIDKARKLLGFEPHTNIEEGIRRFVGWYKSYKNR